MKEYKYNGEIFSVEDTKACEIRVSDKVSTVSITLNESDASVYKVSTVKGGWWWHTNSVEQSIERACRALIDHRKATPSEAACEALHKFVEAI